MRTIVNEIKPVVALATSALMGALLVLGAVTMFGNSDRMQPTIEAPRVLVGIGRFNTTDIRVVPVARPAAR